jgi:hypothetical protein
LKNDDNKGDDRLDDAKLECPLLAKPEANLDTELYFSRTVLDYQSII